MILSENEREIAGFAYVTSVLTLNFSFQGFLQEITGVGVDVPPATFSLKSWGQTIVPASLVQCHSTVSYSITNDSHNVKKKVSREPFL